MTNSNIKRYSLSEQVIDSLERMIRDGEYKIGDKIPTETELMKVFDVSRNTLREAIHSLASAGILDVRQGDGTYVISNNRFAANMNQKYEQVSINDIIEVRKALELTIVSLAAKKRTKEELEIIKEAYLRKNNNNLSKEELINNDIEFHMVIANASHNKLLIDLYKSLYSYLVNQISYKNDNMANLSLIEELHKELYLAIKEQDSIKAMGCVDKILEL